LECSLRLHSGDVNGLSTKWRAGVATLGSGEIRFRRYVPPGIRLPMPLSKEVVLCVASISVGSRRAGLSESWSVSTATEILLVQVPSAEVEWAVLPSQREWAVDQVRGIARAT
jgi:hypothetical protein